MLEPFFECDVDPTDRHIISGAENDFKVVPLMVNGDYAHKVDLVFCGEGYTADKMDKLHADAERFMNYLFTMEPYKSRKNDFNVWLVESISEEAGTDIPNWGQWRKTILNSSFDTFYQDRYLTIQDHRKIASVFRVRLSTAFSLLPMRPNMAVAESIIPTPWALLMMHTPMRFSFTSSAIVLLVWATNISMMMRSWKTIIHPMSSLGNPTFPL